MAFHEAAQSELHELQQARAACRGGLRAHADTRTHTHTHARARASARAHTLARALAPARTRIHTHSHARTRARARTHAHARGGTGRDEAAQGRLACRALKWRAFMVQSAAELGMTAALDLAAVGRAPGQWPAAP